MAARDGDVDSDRVRRYLEERGLVLPDGTWWGAIFRQKEWEWTGRTAKATHDGARSRRIKVWTRAPR